MGRKKTVKKLPSEKNMSRKTNPKILNIFQNEDWLSRGFYKNNFPKYLKEDFEIRKFLRKSLPKGIIEKIEIEREATSLKIIIKTSRPALIIGRGGGEVEKLKKGIDKIIGESKQGVKIEVIAVRNPWASASLSSDWIAIQIEKRMPYRRVLKMALSKIMSLKEIQGARVQVSGRLNGIDISRTEWLQQGKLPRQRIRSIIDYGFSQAYCTYGVIGVKVWIYKGERI